MTHGAFLFLAVLLPSFALRGFQLRLRFAGQVGGQVRGLHRFGCEEFLKSGGEFFKVAGVALPPAFSFPAMRDFRLRLRFAGQVAKRGCPRSFSPKKQSRGGGSGAAQGFADLRF